MFCCPHSSSTIKIEAKYAKLGDILYCGEHFIGKNKKSSVYLPIIKIDVYPTFQIIVFRFDISKNYERLLFDSLEVSENRIIEVERSTNCFSFSIS